MREYDEALHWLRDMQPTLLCFHTSKLQRIKDRYEQMKAVEAVPKLTKSERQKHIESVQEKTRELLNLLRTLPQEQIYGLDEDEERDDQLLTRLEDDLRELWWSLKSAKVYNNSKLQGAADNHLVSRLARLCPEPTCNKKPYSSHTLYEGNFVDFLTENLSYFDIPTTEVQAYAKRFEKWRRETNKDK